jgi:hypothetical protein
MGGFQQRSTSTVSEDKMQIGVETSKAVDQRRVFVVDDDEVTRAALQFMLHDEIDSWAARAVRRQMGAALYLPAYPGRQRPARP